jgi:hypothetical protein
VSLLANSFYAEWRLRHGFAGALRESNSAVPEQLLQSIWHHQRILRDQLKTLDGQPVRILHPGFWNHEAGPDFRNAVVQIGNENAKTGDIEIDLCSSGWRNHGHDKNPNFERVLLHVIWESDNFTEIPAPTLALKPVLDSPIEELKIWLGTESAKGWPENLRGQCCAPLRELSPEALADLLRQAAFVRLQRKGNDFQARARHCGWEQALWEGLFRALGYKHNAWPMLRLAETIPNVEQENRVEEISALFWQSRLLGISGLLPTQPAAADENNYLCEIWNVWWRERHSCSDLIFPKMLWCLNGTRPANSPQRRLALAAHWLADKKFLQKLERWFLEHSSPLDALAKFLNIEHDDFWSHHFTFNSVRLPKPQLLIGVSRISDIAINVILPWFWTRAATGKNRRLRERAEKLYFEWPAAEDNAVLRLARQRLLGGAKPKDFQTAAAQQGLLQIVRDFCEHSNAICEECRFPELVRGLSHRGLAK